MHHNQVSHVSKAPLIQRTVAAISAREAPQTDYIALPQTNQGKRYLLTRVEVTTGWLETYPVTQTTAQNPVLGLKKQILW